MVITSSRMGHVAATGFHSQLKQVRQQRALAQVQLQQLKVKALQTKIRMVLLIQMQRNQTHLQILNNKINPNKIHEDNNKIITTRLTGGLHQGYKPKLPASA